MRARPRARPALMTSGWRRCREAGLLEPLAAPTLAEPPDAPVSHRRMLPVSPADIDLGHAGRMPAGHVLHTRLARLEAGDRCG